jgi:predicted DNA-binding transcriptional regulator AlpA
MTKKPEKKPRRMLTRREAAEELGVSQATLSRWAAERVGPAFVKYDDSRTGAVRYPREELDAYIASRLKSPKP